MGRPSHAIVPPASRCSAGSARIVRPPHRGTAPDRRDRRVTLIDRNGQPESESVPALAGTPAVTVLALIRVSTPPRRLVAASASPRPSLIGLWETDDLAGLIEIVTVNMAAAESLEGPLARLLMGLSRVCGRRDAHPVSAAGASSPITTWETSSSRYFSTRR